MGDLNIPIIEPSVDYTKIPPINQKRTIAFINHFTAHTVEFLNKFALTCEEKLFEFENKLQRIEASLALLESKFSSIPELNVANEPVKPQEPEKIEEKQEEPKVEEKEIQQKVEDNNLQPISSDPVYKKYFKMMHFGVPKPAVKLKMQQEGLDPSLLDTPNHMVPKQKADDSPEED